MALVSMKKMAATMPAAAGAPAAGTPATAAVAAAPSGAPAETADVQPDPRTIAVSVAAVLLLSAVATWLNAQWHETVVAPVLPTDLALFAMVFVAAQAVERLLEPFGMIWNPTAEQKARRDRAVRDYENAAKAGEPAATVLALANTAATEQAMLDKLRANRMVVNWALGTVMGMFAAAYMGVYLLHTMGIEAAPRYGEILGTGLIIGAGTKPLHDLISRIEKSKEKAQDPDAASGD